MRVLLGLDPGGARNFGWCIADEGGGTFPAKPIASGLSDNASQAIAAALDAMPAGGVPAAAGIDAPLYWSRSGARIADRLVRSAIANAGAPHAAGTVQDVNSLRGACLVQGMLAALALREKFPALPITEAHPKALRWLLPGAASVTAASEHERDALLAAIGAGALLHWPAGWSNLLDLEVDAYSPVARPLSYAMPNVSRRV